MITPWPPKAVADVVTHQVDWPTVLGIDAGIISAVATGSGVTVDEQSVENGISTVTLSAGVNGTVAAVSFALVLDTEPQQSFTRVYSILIDNEYQAVTPTTATKRTVTLMCFEECGLPSYEFDATTEEYTSAMRKLDALMGEWKAMGIDLGYNFPATFGGGQLTDVSGLPDNTLNTVAIALAFRVAPGLGKTMSAESKKALNDGMTVLRANYAVIPERTFPRRTPRGAGNKPWSTWSPFMGDILQ